MKLIDEIYGHLGAAKSQILPDDDAIISQHVIDAYFLADRLHDVLADVTEYLDRHADVLDGEPNRPVPNEAMRLLMRLRGEV